MSDTPCDRPIIVLTGGIASGKSTVAKMLARLGAVIISADDIARQVVERGQPILKEIEKRFGSLALTPEGGLDRAYMASKIFTDKDARLSLETLIHPLIGEEMNRQIAEARKCLKEDTLIVVEIPLYFEGKHRYAGAETWVVYVDEATQLTRLMARDDLGRADALARIKSQMPLSEKCQLADRIIDNNAKTGRTWAQVVEAMSDLLSRA